VTAAQERRLLLAALDFAHADARRLTALRGQRAIPRRDDGYTAVEKRSINALHRERHDATRVRYLAKLRLLRAAGADRPQLEIDVRPALRAEKRRKP
jgi:hypothetical protein